MTMLIINAEDILLAMLTGEVPAGITQAEITQSLKEQQPLCVYNIRTTGGKWYEKLMHTTTKEHKKDIIELAIHDLGIPDRMAIKLNSHVSYSN